MGANVVENHLREIHRGLESLSIQERTRVKDHLNILLLNVIPGDKSFLRRFLREPNPSVNRHEPKQRILSDPVVDIHSVSQ